MATDVPRLPLLAAGVAPDAPDAPLCWREGRPLSRRRFLQDLRRLARSLPEGGPVLAMTADRYRFALAFGAAALRGQAALMPPNHTPDLVARLCELFPRAYAVADAQAPAIALPTQAFPPEQDEAAATPEEVLLPIGQDVAHVLTSGSTGRPLPHAKRWDLLVASMRAGAARMAEALGRADLHGVTIVGTVPAHHMYGFEFTLLLPLQAGAAFAAERPFFPQDIVRVLAALPRPRVLVTTPVHLKALVESALALPPVDLVLSATAPLSPELAARAEAALGGPLVEIYGCTEAGQVASRRPTRSADWETLGGIVLAGDGGATSVSGGHVGAPTPLADVLQVLSPTRFRLVGRSNDLVNVAGKRSSLAHLNHQLTGIPGVRDGAFWLPPGHGDNPVVRLVAVVVAPGLDRAALRAALRERVDAAFLPRRILRVDALPRDPTGKLPAARLAELAMRLLAEDPRA